ncbi:MAG: hypothetical protein QM751_13690 [Paludibacteraceae bacterium]
MQIFHLKHDKIDLEKWDNIISASKNSMIYANSWFLNVVSPDWEALVSDNYEYVMPLPVKKKLGIKYLVQPIIAKQLGIFSSGHIDALIVSRFIKSIPYYSYEINLNEGNCAESGTKLPNLLLNLALSYDNLVKSFSVNTMRNIRKAGKCLLRIDWELNLNDFLHFYFEEERYYLLPDKKITTTLIKTALEHNNIQLIGAKTLDGRLIAVLGLLTSTNRLIYLLASSNKEGKNKSAMFFLVNEVIRKNANTDVVLDFEGSKIDGIARFYKGFGAKPISYFSIKRFRPTLLIKQ